MSAARDNRPSPVPIANSELLEYDSTCVGGHYLIKVRLPETYAESNEAYPVLYMPDGDMETQETGATEHTHSKHEQPGGMLDRLACSWWERVVVDAGGNAQWKPGFDPD